MKNVSFQFKFSKVMAIKQSEKDRMLNEYNEAVSQFEEVGQRLYQCLKHKENFIDEYNEEMSIGVSVEKLKQSQNYMDYLEREIEVLQQKMNIARQTMRIKEVKLREKNIEVKKYEKMETKSLIHYQNLQRESEAKQMDEVSIQQYLLKGIR
ncbi:flagellar export protein FliJ [Priestia endophytica]|uniref:flagellar export protein FliJ n=1 Tax=Priestia endophytica TaxID=135735 RepID=UPI0009ED87C5